MSWEEGNLTTEVRTPITTPKRDARDSGAHARRMGRKTGSGRKRRKRPLVKVKDGRPDLEGNLVDEEH